MPFIVTTKRPGYRGGPGTMRPDDGPDIVSRLAVATHYDVWDVVPTDARKGLIGMDESGGTIGPLPDGTVTEVAPMSWERLGDLMEGGYIVRADGEAATRGRLLDAFNAREGSMTP